MIYISSSSIDGGSIENCIKELIHVGINNIELSGGARYSDNILRSLKNLKDIFSINFLIHNYFPPPKEDFVLNIASHDVKQRQRSIQFVKTSIDMACEIGVDRYTVHAGYTRNFRPNQTGSYFVADDSEGISHEHANHIMLQTLFEIQKYAAERKIKIGLENLFPIDDAPESSLLCTPFDIFRFLDSVAEDDNIGLLLDLGHVLISADYFGFYEDEFIKTLREKYHHKILGVHLSGNDGKYDYHGLLSHDCWQLKAVQQFNYETIPVTIESRGLSPDSVLSQYKMIQSILERNT